MGPFSQNVFTGHSRECEFLNSIYLLQFKGPGIVDAGHCISVMVYSELQWNGAIFNIISNPIFTCQNSF